MYDLEDTILNRHSTRLFLRDKPVPHQLVTEALELAIRAPSNSNIQPWHVVFASGAARDRLVEALVTQADIAAPSVPPLPEQFAHHRRDLGALVYGTMGVARHDSEARRLAVLRNWEFFRAPLAGIVCMHRDLGLRRCGRGRHVPADVCTCSHRQGTRQLRPGLRRRLSRHPPRTTRTSETSTASCAGSPSDTPTPPSPPTISTSRATPSRRTSRSLLISELPCCTGYSKTIHQARHKTN